jgi:endogenous inhibitor of DNA gyrase (YacG/DUF329 family)
MCGNPSPPRAAGNRAFPFCSPRCKLLDLGKWLDEDYRIPGPRAGDGERAPGPASPAAGEEEP